MYYSHILSFIIAAYSKCLQYIIYIYTAHGYIKCPTVFKYLMYAHDLRIKMFFHLISLIISPLCKHAEYIISVGTNQFSINIPALVFLYKLIIMIFFLMKLFACQTPHCISVIQIVFQFFLLLNRKSYIRLKFKFFHRLFVCQSYSVRNFKYFIKILHTKLKTIRQMFCSTYGHGRVILAFITHLPYNSYISTVFFYNCHLYLIVVLPNKTFYGYTVTGFIIS